MSRVVTTAPADPVMQGSQTQGSKRGALNICKRVTVAVM